MSYVGTPKPLTVVSCAQTVQAFGQMLHDDERIHLPKGFKAPGAEREET